MSGYAVGWKVKNDIYIQDQQLIYYGNPAGYLTEEKLLLDPLFDKEQIHTFVNEKLKIPIEIQRGVYDCLMNGNKVTATKEMGKRFRIYQLQKHTPFSMRFICLAERIKRGYGMPQKKEYEMVYEEEISVFELDAIWERFGRKVPVGFPGHTLSVSDVVELVDGSDHRFFYLEPKGYTEIQLED